jgi:xanthine/uracil/vitamin C permease (AzgA family)
MFGAIGRYFNFAELKTDYRSEVIGGVTTFMAWLILSSTPFREYALSITAPAVITVGCMMMQRWPDRLERLQRFDTGFSGDPDNAVDVQYRDGNSFRLDQLRWYQTALRQGREVPWLVYLLAVVFILRFIYLKSL